MFVFWCSGLYFCEVFKILLFFFFFCLISTCNQIAIWYSQVVQLSVRETQSLTWLGAKPILRVNQRDGVRKVVLHCSQGIWSFVHIIGSCWALETGLACRMKHLMQLNSYCHIRSLPPLFCHVLQLVVPYLMFTFTQVNSLYTSTVYEKNVTVNFFFFNTHLLPSFEESTMTCLHDEPKWTNCFVSRAGSSVCPQVLFLSLESKFGTPMCSLAIMDGWLHCL